MKTIATSLVLSLALLESAAIADADPITLTGTYASAIITPTGSYTVSVSGTNTLIDVYDIAVQANDLSKTISAFDVRIGPNAADPDAPTGGVGAFQVWKSVDPAIFGYDLQVTPFREDCGTLSTANYTRQADTHFVSGVKNLLAGMPAAETNDSSILPLTTGGYQIGLGYLRGAYGVIGAQQMNLQDAVSVGVVHGADVWMYLGVATVYAMQGDFFRLRINDTVSTFPGDANVDGRVDIDDLAKVLTNYDHDKMRWYQGDFNNDGMVDTADLSKVLTNYNKTAGAAAGTPAGKAVPEPSTGVLILAGLTILAAITQRRRP